MNDTLKRNFLSIIQYFKCLFRSYHQRSSMKRKPLDDCFSTSLSFMPSITLPLLPFFSMFLNMLGTNNFKQKDWSYQPKLHFFMKKH